MSNKQIYLIFVFNVDLTYISFVLYYIQELLSFRQKEMAMTLADIIQDIHTCEEDMLMYERKYGILTPTFYESFMQGDEPPNEAWVLDWNGWAATYEVWLRRWEQYEKVIQTARIQTPLITVIEKAANRESIPVPA